MKEVFRKIIASVLTLLVLFSTVSFTVEKHYCGNFLIDVAVFSEVKDCGMVGMDYQRDNTNDLCNTSEIKRKSCCTNEKVVIEGQDELKVALDQLVKSQQLFITTFLKSYHIVFSGVDQEEIHFKEYDPPNLVYDFQILHETFLI